MATEAEPYDVIVMKHEEECLECGKALPIGERAVYFTAEVSTDAHGRPEYAACYLHVKCHAAQTQRKWNRVTWAKVQRRKKQSTALQSQS